METLTYPVAAVVERLRSAQSIKLVGLAPDLANALSTPPRVTPAVYLVTSVTGGAVKYSGPPVQQERVTTLAHVVWVRHHGDTAAVRAELDDVLAEIDAVYAGWSPGEAFGDLVLTQARDEFAHAQYLCVQAHYTSAWDFQAERRP